MTSCNGNPVCSLIDSVISSCFPIYIYIYIYSSFWNGNYRVLEKSSSYISIIKSIYTHVYTDLYTRRNDRLSRAQSLSRPQSE